LLSSGTFLLLSGITTGVLWLSYFRALQLGPASRVSSIGKLSLPLTILLAAVFLHESVGWRLGLAIALMTIGAVHRIGSVVRAPASPVRESLRRVIVAVSRSFDA
jgi:uncharacterized membrane protein